MDLPRDIHGLANCRTCRKPVLVVDRPSRGRRPGERYNPGIYASISIANLIGTEAVGSGPAGEPHSCHSDKTP